MGLGQRDVRRAGEIGPDVGTVHRFLAGDPGAPRRRSAGAVHLGAVEARERPEDFAVLGDHDRRRATPRHRVVRHSAAVGRSHRRPRIVDLVVADQDHVAVPASERRHSVVTTGQRCSVVECDRHLRVVERAVLETRWQPQSDQPVAEIRHRPEWERSWWRRCLHRSGDVARERSRPGHDACGSGPLQNRTTIENDHDDASCPRKRQYRSPPRRGQLPAGASDQTYQIWPILAALTR